MSLQYVAYDLYKSERISDLWECQVPTFYRGAWAVFTLDNQET